MFKTPIFLCSTHEMKEKVIKGGSVRWVESEVEACSPALNIDEEYVWA